VLYGLPMAAEPRGDQVEPAGDRRPGLSATS